ncbi:MAG: hypothetical protein CVU87_07560 [Firmicutes bacterium HGW-Firmicutes-12]|jgi:TRAP-type C4-dicarboxylate transport system permease small subunit|nr:MAG: hypothetical protein CVU87_07560 [Firmicutes bacterium HGW-Firmicutes-12]
MGFEGILKKMYDGIFSFLVLIVSAMLLIGAMQVFSRYVIQYSLYWSEEIMRYLNIWTIFLGLSVGIPRGIHVAIDALIGSLKGKKKEIATLIVQALTLVFLILLVVIGIKFTIFNMGQLSPAIRIPLSYVYISIPIGGFLALLFTIGEIIKSRRDGVVQ